MKQIISILIFVAFSVQLYAGGFRFPNVNYKYAKVYLYNIALQDESFRPDFDIYNENGYALSKLGDGYEVNNQLVADMNVVFSLGVGIMVDGLSKCYIPRHGIIFFDEHYEPVASLSICFECMKMDFWSTTEMIIPAEKYSEKNAKKAEGQFESLMELFKKNNIPVLNSDQAYVDFVDSKKEDFECKGEMVFDFSGVPFFKETPTMNLIKTWMKASNSGKLEKVINSFYSVIGKDTTAVNFTSSLTNGIDIFEFDDTTSTAKLVTAKISSNAFLLPNKIQNGLSLEQVQNTFQVWDGLSNPSSIIVNYQDIAIRYQFKNRTLKQIKIASFKPEMD